MSKNKKNKIKSVGSNNLRKKRGDLRCPWPPVEGSNDRNLNQNKCNADF